MRYLVMLEQIESGFAIQVPDLAVITTAPSLEAAKVAAIEAIESNLAAYTEANQIIPSPQAPHLHLDNPAFKDHVFTYVEVSLPSTKLAA